MILPKLEIFGLTKAQEEAIFACLLSGEPCLFMGPPGTAKTEIIAAIGAALREDSKRENPNDSSRWFSYQIYDASKLNFEDLTGFPNIEKLKQGSIEYISSPSSIWGKELIAFDELNRCAEDRQGNLLEIIRSRKLGGVPTGNKFIFSTINPFGDTGTVEMADPLVDRNLFFIKFDKFDEMAPANRTRVMLRAGSVDGVGLKYWGAAEGRFDTSDKVDNNGKVIYINDKLADIGKEIRIKMTDAQQYYDKLRTSSSAAIATLIDKVVAAFKIEFDKESEAIKKEVSLSGRRCGFILRGILAVRAIQLASKEEGHTLDDFSVVIANTMKLALPIGIGGKANKQIIDRANIKLEETVKNIWPTIKKTESTEDINLIAEALNTNNPMKMLDVLLSVDMQTATKDAILASISSKEKYRVGNSAINEQLYSYSQALLYVLNKQIPGFIPPHIKINCTAADADAASQVNSIALGILEPYEEIIVAAKNQYKNNPVINLAMRGCLQYITTQANITDGQVIQSIVEMKKLLASIYAKINTHTNDKNNSTPAQDTKAN